jgi:hypothetical protein
MTKTLKVVYLCDWLPPDFGAVGQLELQKAREDARSGIVVTLIGFNSRCNSEEIDSEGSGKLVVRRIHRPLYDRSAWIRRALWTLSSNLLLIWHSRREIYQADEIRFTGSPPYLLHFVMPVAWILGKRTRYRISDFHPECLIADLGRSPWWIKPIHALTQFWRRRVTLFEVLGEDQKRRLVEQGIPEERVQLKRDTTPILITGKERGSFRPAGMRTRFTVMYSGNWGRAHESDTLIQAFRNLAPETKSRIALWLNCVGKEAQHVFDSLGSEPGLMVHFTKPAPLDDLPELLASSDCQLITLKDAFVGYVLPSKVYGCIASGKPILYIGSQDSDVHKLCVERAGHGYYQVNCGDWIRVGQILEMLAQGTRA